MNRIFTVSVLMLLALFCLWGCEHDTTNGPVDPGGGNGAHTDLTCLGCHSSEDMLQEALGGEEGSKVAVAHKDDG